MIISRLLFFFSLIYFVAAPEAVGQEHRFASLSTTQARPVAMAGAFTAVEDHLAAINFNPAAYSLYKSHKSHRVTFFLNPVSPVIGMLERDALYAGNGSKTDDILSTLGLLVKSVSFSFHPLEIGLLLGEESLDRVEAFSDSKAFGVSGYRQNHSHTLVGRLRLAKQVSLGGTVSLLYGSKEAAPHERHGDIGFSYGILLRPEDGLKIGVAFFNLPDSLSQTKLDLERLVDESVNIGVSYQVLDGTLVSMDMRNLGEERGTAVREIHFGLEQVFFSHLAVRTGFFRKSGQNVLSWGVGLFDGNSLFGFDNKFTQHNFFLNYAFVLEDTPQKQYEHLLSLYFRM